MSLPMASADQQFPIMDPHLLEFCKNLLFASHYKQCTTASELLQKVVALKCIQDNGMMNMQASEPELQPSTSSGLYELPISTTDDSMEVDEDSDEEEEEVDDDGMIPQQIHHSAGPVFFNSMAVVIENLQKEGVDSQVSESIALDRLSSPSANPLSFMGGIVINGDKLCKVDSDKLKFVKRLLKKMHDHENFNRDGAPFAYDVKAALRFSEKLHRQIPSLQKIEPTYVAHEQSITLTAMGRFMAMHECFDHSDLRVMFPGTTHLLEERAYYSSVFWTYREAFKAFYYPTMPPPLPNAFQLTPTEKHILRRYWNAGNRHVSVTEATLLSRRCPSLAPYQIYGWFDRRRRLHYSQYCDVIDRESLTRESTVLLKKLRERKRERDDDSDEDEDEDELDIQREFLNNTELAQLNLMWECGHTSPTRNECELWSAHFNIESAEQAFAYFEDRRWREQYEHRKTIRKSRRNDQKQCLLDKLQKAKEDQQLLLLFEKQDNEASFSGTFQKN